MPATERWRARLRTAHAMLLLCRARLLVACVPFRLWRDGLGLAPGRDEPDETMLARARRLASHVERAAWRLPIATKCLPRAMALSWLLRRATIPHQLVFAIRPPGARDAGDALHAWVEAGGRVILGDLPGPWAETLRLGKPVSPANG